MKETVIPIVGTLGIVLQRPGKEVEETGAQWKNRDHSGESVVKIR